MEWYNDKPCRFIYHTTGPKGGARTLKSRGYEPQVTVFSMCRPVPDLDKHLSLDFNTGRVHCHLSGMDSYDIWSAYSMSYHTGDPRPQPPLAMRFAQLPPDHMRIKRRRYTVKTTVIQPVFEVGEEMPPSYEPQPSSLKSEHIKQEAEAPAAEVDKQTSSCSELQPPTRPGNLREKPMLPGYEPQQSSPHSESMTQEAREAFDDMVDLFLTQRKCLSVNGAYNMLYDDTRAYLKALKADRLAD